MDPDHDVCSVVNGPERSGVSDDFSQGSAGENHPIAQPYPSITMFAIKWERENSIIFGFSSIFCDRLENKMKQTELPETAA